jgi:NTE family protein
MKMTVSDLLNSVSLFAGLDDQVRDALVERLKQVQLGRGDTLFREGERGAALYLVETGAVRVMGSDGKREVCRLGPREHVGEMSLIDQAPRSATVIAACDTTLWQLSADDFAALCDAHPRVHKQVAIALAQRLRDTTMGGGGHPSETVVLLLDARHSPGRPDAVRSLIKAVAATTHRPVFTLKLGKPKSEPFDSAGTSWIEEPESLSHRVDGLQHDYGHVFLEAQVAADDRLLRAACGRADLALVLFTADPPSLDLAKSILARLAGLPEGISPPVELAIDRREENPRRAWEPIDELAGGRRIHTIAQTPGYAASGSPDFDGFGRLARRIARCRVGLVMGGGGARAFAHVGVIAAFERAGIPVDVLAGTSGGAIVAGLAARDWSAAQISDFLLERWTRRGVVDWGLFPWVSLLRGRKLEMIGKHAGEGLTLQELTRPVVVVATDLVTGDAVHLRRGDGWTAVRASLSVPGVFPPVRDAGRYLVDGGAIDNLPANAARELGADIVIGVNVSPPLEPAFLRDAAEQTPPPFFERFRQWRLSGGLPLFRIIYRTITVQGEALKSRQGTPDLTICPDVSNYDMFEFRNLRPIIEIGRAAAEAQLDAIRDIISSSATGAVDLAAASGGAVEAATAS